MRGIRTVFILLVLLGATAATSVHAADRNRGVSLDATLQPYLARYGLPALAAAIMRNGRFVGSGAVGTRRAGSDNRVTINDRFHIGSDTKAMTSLLAAMLVERGKLRWTSTVADVFPELVTDMDADVKSVTLEQLLSHTSGIPSDNDAHNEWIQQSFTQEKKNLDELRYWLIKRLVAQPLQSKPGAQFAYANMGYILAGAMLEKTSGTTWEELMVTRVFEPLGLKSAGFGPQSDLGRIDAPLGHLPRPEGPKPMLAGPNGDNPAIMGPAGTVHMSVLDLAAWASWNAGEGNRGPALIAPQTLSKLHTKVIDMPAKPDAAPGTPSSGSYGFGWVTIALPFAREPFLFHGGSNEMNIAYILLQPKFDFAIVMATNIGGLKADEALKELGKELYTRFGSR